MTVPATRTAVARCSRRRHLHSLFECPAGQVQHPCGYWVLPEHEPTCPRCGQPTVDPHLTLFDTPHAA